MACIWGPQPGFRATPDPPRQGWENSGLLKWGQLCHPSLPYVFFAFSFLSPSNLNPFQAVLLPARSSGSQWVHRLFGFPKIVHSPNVVGGIVCAVCTGRPTEANTMSLFLFLSLGPSEVISELCCLRSKTGRDKSWTLEFFNSFCWIQRTKSSPSALNFSLTFTRLHSEILLLLAVR